MYLRKKMKQVDQSEIETVCLTCLLSMIICRNVDRVRCWYIYRGFDVIIIKKEEEYTNKSNSSGILNDDSLVI